MIRALGGIGWTNLVILRTSSIVSFCPQECTNKNFLLFFQIIEKKNSWIFQCFTVFWTNTVCQFLVVVIFKIVCFYCTGIGGIHSNIKILDLCFNNITTIAKQFFRPVELSLTHLHLSHNNLLNATREVFGNLRHLQWLDISHNVMYEMDFDMFRNTKRLQVRTSLKSVFVKLL